MPQSILQYRGVFNVWDSVADQPVFAQGVDEETVRQHMLRNNPNINRVELEQRLQRARTLGSGDSSMDVELAALNYRDEQGQEVPLDDFVRKVFNHP